MTRELLKRFSRRASWIDRAEADRTALHWIRRIDCSSCGEIRRWVDLSCNKSPVWYRKDRCSRTSQRCCHRALVPLRDIVSSGNIGNRSPSCKCHRMAGNRPYRFGKLESGSSVCWRSHWWQDRRELRGAESVGERLIHDSTWSVADDKYLDSAIRIRESNPIESNNNCCLKSVEVWWSSECSNRK